MIHLKRFFLVFLSYSNRLLETGFKGFTVGVCFEGVFMVQSGKATV